MELFGELVAYVRSLGRPCVAAPGRAGRRRAGGLHRRRHRPAAVRLAGGEGPLLDVVRVTGLVESTDVPASEDGSLKRAAGHRPKLRPDLLPAAVGPARPACGGVRARRLGRAGGRGAVEPRAAVCDGWPARGLGGRWRRSRRAALPDQIGDIGRTRCLSSRFRGPRWTGSRSPAPSWSSSPAPIAPVGRSGPQSRYWHVRQPRRGAEWTFDASGPVLVGGSEPESLPAHDDRHGRRRHRPRAKRLARADARHPLDLVIGGGRTGLTLGDIQLGVSGAVEDGVADVGFSLLAAGSSVGISTSDFGRIVSAILDFERHDPVRPRRRVVAACRLRLAGSASLEMPLADGFDIGIIAFSVRLAFSPTTHW